MTLSIATAKISTFAFVSHKQPQKDTTLEDFYKEIRSNKWWEMVAGLQAIKAKDGHKPYKEARKKSGLPLVTPSGVFSIRENNGLVLHSGLYSYDIDNLTEAEVKRLRTTLPERLGGHLALCFISPGGEGLKLFLRGPVAEDEDDHLLKWERGATLVRRVWPKLDATMDVSRLCFYSCDPAAYYNREATPFGEQNPGVVAPKSMEAILDDLDKQDEEIDNKEIAEKLDLAAARVPGLDLATAREILTHLCPFVDYNEWFPTVMSLRTQWGQTNDEGQAYELAHEWSRGMLWAPGGEVGGGVEGSAAQVNENNYSREEVDKVWRSAKRKNGKLCTMKTVIAQARMLGWEPDKAKEAENWKGQILRDGNGMMIKCVSNLSLVLRYAKLFAGKLRWDDFAKKREYIEDGQWRALSDTDYIEIHIAMERALKTGLSPQMIVAAVQMVAEQNKVNTLTDYLNGLQWDGVERGKDLFRRGFDAQEREIYEVAGMRFLIASVARALRPGCKVDTVPVVIGAQGRKKSSSWRLLFGDQFFKEGHLDLDNGAKDTFQVIQGAWGFEMAEMTTLRRADRNMLKGFVTKQVDTYRPSYGREVVDMPRRVIFVGTDNEKNFLKDPTGNRRWWPVFQNTIGSFEDQRARSNAAMLWIKENRDQLWAEAVVRFKRGESWWLDGGQEEVDMKNIQEMACDKAEWEGLVEAFILDRANWRKTQTGLNYLVMNELYAMLVENTIRPDHSLKIGLGQWLQRRFGGKLVHKVVRHEGSTTNALVKEMSEE